MVSTILIEDFKSVLEIEPPVFLVQSTAIINFLTSLNSNLGPSTEFRILTILGWFLN